MIDDRRVSTGYAGLDEILDGLRMGDNVVLKVDSIDDYRYFIGPYVDRALAHGRRIVYIRFGDHLPLLGASDNISIHELDPRLGFEIFTTRIYQIITDEGPGTFYVFDCLSDLLSAWATDYMIGNFFRVICPYLFELDTVAYFSLIRDRHAFKTIEQIRSTTQVLVDVFTHEGHFHVQPLKVWQRSSPTMFLPHRKEGERFVPLANSYEATRLLSTIGERNRDGARRQIDHWHRLFIDAEELAEKTASQDESDRMVRHICRHMIGKEERILKLAREHFSLQDLLRIKARLIGTGFIGGKAVGMLLAHNILMQDSSFDWRETLETQDSFYIGSNVYYSFIIHNGLWNLFMRQKTRQGYLPAAQELREQMLEGSFPDHVRQGLQQMLEYYGQYPIIIRSSSLLEDGFGNAFAGKYDSYFRVNQGSPEDRMEQLEDAIRKVFASAMSEDALVYRQQRGLDDQDEQMALLVQRVSGSYRKHFYFPELSGVGVSYNTFVWDRDMDPRAGMLRLVLGLGTRAVDRAEADYPRIVALDAPSKRPHKGLEDTRKFTQRDVDLLNVESNCLETISLLELGRQELDIPWQNYGIKDLEVMGRIESRGRKAQDVWLLTFDRLLCETNFTALMQRLLKTVEKAYNYPVDVEFTVNLNPQGEPRIGIVQCRPLQTKGEKKAVEIPAQIPDEQLFFRSDGNFMGGNVSQPLKWIIWVDPTEYIRLPLAERYEIARLVGRLNKRIANRVDSPTMLMGPGRWGTSTPSLGVPINFSEINNFTALAEVAYPPGGLMPELSFGSHFFQDLVETDIFYLALFPQQSHCYLNEQWLQGRQNALESLMPASSRYKKVVKVCRLAEAEMRLMSDVVQQRLVCALNQ